MNNPTCPHGCGPLDWHLDQWECPVCGDEWSTDVFPRREGQGRRYAMTRLAAGDYLLPSNDARTLWRLNRYAEDGSATRNDGSVILGQFWAVWTYRGRIDDLRPDDIDDWSYWECVATNLATRSDAIAEALSLATGSLAGDAPVPATTRLAGRGRGHQ